MSQRHLSHVSLLFPWPWNLAHPSQARVEDVVRQLRHIINDHAGANCDRQDQIGRASPVNARRFEGMPGRRNVEPAPVAGQAQSVHQSVDSRGVLGFNKAKLFGDRR
jgi:hypothetical protein